MYELIQAGKSSYYMDCPSRSGIYLINDKDVCIIDGGSDSGSAKKLSAHITNMGWNPVMLLNTHSHADHDGGNAFLQQKYSIPVYCSDTDASLIRNSIIQPTTLYGAYPNKDMLTKFFYAKPSNAAGISEEVLPSGLSFEFMPGHSPMQTIYKTRDEIWFIGDVITPKATIEKYHVSYLYNIEAQINTLNKLNTLKGNLYIPSHGPVLDQTEEIVKTNLEHIEQILSFLKEQCKKPKTVDELLKAFFDENDMQLNLSQHLLCGATFRSYMTYLYDKDIVEAVFDDNILKYVIK